MAARKAKAVTIRYTPLTFTRMVWKHRLLLTSFWFGLTMLCFAGLYFWPDQYRSETLILVDSQKIPEHFVSSTVSAELQDRLATLSQQILSSTRLEGIIDKFHLYEKQRVKETREEIVERMRADTKIALEKGWAKDRPGAFRIAYHAPTAQLAADVANQLGNLFVEENLRAREVQAEGTSEFFKSQLLEAKTALDQLEQKVSVYKQQHNGQLPQQEPSLNSALARMQVELQGIQDAINRSEQQKTMLETAVAAAEASEASLLKTLERTSAIKLDGSPRGMSLKDVQRDREDVQTRLDQLRIKYREEHPDIKVLKSQLEYFRGLEKRLAESDGEKKAGSAVASTLPPEAQRAMSIERERVLMLRSQLAMTAKEIDFRTGERQEILARISKYQGRLENLPIREQEMAAVTRDYEISKAHYLSLLNKIHAVDMAADMERRQKAERFTVLDPARAPEKPVAPNRPLLGAAGCFLALVLGLTSVVALELRKNVLLGDWEIPKNIPVLGRVPLMAPEPTLARMPARLAGSALAAAAIGLAVYVAARG